MENADEPESGKNPEKTPSARSTSRGPSARGSAARKPAVAGKPAARSKPAATGKPSGARKPAATKAASTRSASVSAAESPSASAVDITDENVESPEQPETESQPESVESVDRAPFAVPQLSVPKISMGADRRGPAPDADAEPPTEHGQSDGEPDDVEHTDTEQADTEQADTEQTDSEQTDSEQADTEQADSEQADSEQADHAGAESHEQSAAEQTDAEQDGAERTGAAEPEQAGTATEPGTDLEVASGSIAPPEYEPVAGADLVPVPMPSDTDAMLSIRGLTKRFDDTVAVRAIDLDVPAGSIFGIVGPNGAGKTTTLSMITGLLRPDAGTVTVHGADVWAEPVAAKRQLGVLPDRLRLFDRLTGSQLLYYSAVLRGLDGPVAKQRVADLAAVFRIEDALGRLVSDYSTGMTKKVALAAAMIHAPRMLVLDEPFESVDPVSAATVMGILRDYVAAGGTVLLSSHSMALVERICDRVAVIVDGDVLAVGSIDEVRGDVSLEERFVQLAGSTAELEGVEWLHTFSD